MCRNPPKCREFSMDSQFMIVCHRRSFVHRFLQTTGPSGSHGSTTSYTQTYCREQGEHQTNTRVAVNSFIHHLPLAPAVLEYPERTPHRKICQESPHTHTHTRLLQSLFSLCAGCRPGSFDPKHFPEGFTTYTHTCQRVSRQENIPNISCQCVC